jgi:hypothetical protein
VSLEVKLDRHSRPSTALERIDRAVQDPPDRPVDSRTAQLVGHLMSVVSIVIVRSPRPILRVVIALDPTAAGEPPPSTRELTALSCHSASRDGSVTYENTYSGDRAISMLDATGAIAPPSPVTTGLLPLSSRGRRLRDLSPSA